MLQLFRLIEADLDNFRPRDSSLDLPDEVTASGFAGSTEPHFPKSLYLIQPLATAYPLNPVASTAQASVPIPEGLDLDAWIVPPPKDEELGESTDRKKSKKGKEKEGSRSRKSGKKKQRPENEVTLTPAEPEVETPDERAERERVRLYLPHSVTRF